MIDLNDQLEVWVGDGIITTEQAEMMRRSVAHPEPAPEPADTEAEERIPIITEVLGYVGIALAGWAVYFLVEDFWGNLSDWAQASLFGVLALVLFVAGTTLLDAREPAFRRLAGVLWAGSAVAAGGALFIVFDRYAEFDPEVTWAMIGAIGSAAGGAMLMRNRAVAQHTVFFAAILITIESLLTLGPDPDLFFYGLSVWGCGVVWTLVSRAGILQPLKCGMVLGALAMMVGAQMTGAAGDLETAGVLLGLATAGLLTGAGVMLRERLLVIFGGISIFLFVPQAMRQLIGDEMGAVFGMFVTGLILVGLAIWFGRHKEAL